MIEIEFGNNKNQNIQNIKKVKNKKFNSNNEHLIHRFIQTKISNSRA